ncbi:MAG: sensor histidine kinase [Myxococcota bacterium]
MGNEASHKSTDLKQDRAPPRTTALVIGVITIIAGSSVLVGWQLDIAALKSVLPSFMAMKPNAAVAFIFAGASLALTARFASSAPARWAAHACAVATALIGLLTVCQYLFGMDLGIDQWLFLETAGGVGTVAPGRMAATVAFNMLLLGCALLFAADRRAILRVQRAALLAGAVGLLALLGYLYGADAHSTFGFYTQMAIHAAVLFVLLSVGVLLLHPAEGLLLVFTRDSPGGWLVRRIGPFVLAIPVVLGWLRIYGERINLFGAPLGTALMMILMMGFFSGLLYWAAGRLNAADDQLRMAHEGRLTTALTREEAVLRRMATVVRDSNDAITIQDFNGEVLAWNRGAARMYGYSEAEAVGTSIDRLTTSDKVAEHKDFVRRLVAGEEVTSFETRRVTKDGRVLDVWMTVTKLVDHGGKPIGLASTERDITARNRATAELEVANKELEAFSYSVSHDLRAPLRHVQGYVDMLARDSESQLSEKGRRYMKTIGDVGREMGMLIDDLLAFSRMGRAELVETTANLDLLVQHALRDLEPVLRTRNIVWTLHPLPAVQADSSMLKLVLDNLLGNAVKFTLPRDPARIEIGTAGTGDGRVILFVRDNGVGFDPRFAHKLFGVFQRLHRADQFEGTGIGLANVRRIIARHGGRTWAEGVLDQGATFYFTLKPAGAGGKDHREGEPS